MSDFKKEHIFVDGMIVRRADTAADYVLCNLSIKVAELIAFMNQHQSNGWVNIACLRAKSGDKCYAELDTWRPTQGDSAKAGIAQAKAVVEDKFTKDDIPF
jgi:hypothetical protein